MNVYEAILREANRRRALMPKRELGTPVRLEDLPANEITYRMIQDLKKEMNDEHGSRTDR